MSGDSRLEPLLKKRKCEFKGRAIVDDEWTCQQPTTRVFVGCIIDKKLVSSVLEKLNIVSPIPALKHLRRVRKNGHRLEIILSEYSDVNTSSSTIDLLHSDIPGLEDAVEVLEVAACCPVTQEQYKFSRNLWPTNFHENQYIEKLLTCNVFSTADQSAIREATCRLEDLKTSISAIIINPVDGKVMGEGMDRRDGHPLHHAVMAALDEVSNKQREFPDESYLCTGFDAFMREEPCIMCAMALLHSRIRRVFYRNAKPNGALGSLCKLNCFKVMNHSFEVFHGFPVFE